MRNRQVIDFKGFAPGITKVRPSPISTRGFDTAHDHQFEGRLSGELRRVRETIEAMQNLWDSAEAIAGITDPLSTPGARALKVRADVEQAKRHAKKLRDQTIARLEARAIAIRKDAERVAGVDQAYPQDRECRGRLVALDQKSRDAAINHAIETGDKVVMSAIWNYGPLYTGRLSVPKEALQDLYLNSVVGTLREETETLSSAARYLDMAHESFQKVDDFRMKGEETRAVQGEAEVSAADQALVDAIKNTAHLASLEPSNDEEAA